MLNTIYVLLVAYIAVAPSPAIGFGGTRWRCPCHKSSSALHAWDDGYADARHSTGNPTFMNRRDWIGQSALVSTVFLGSNAFADDSISARTVPKGKSVIILGANGGTGRECVSAVLASGRSCYATARSGSFNYDEESGSSLLRKDNLRLFQNQADVSSLAGLLALVDKINSSTSVSVGAMIFAASASASGNNALDVDYQGVINAGKVCIEKNIPRLVVVSSGAVTRPNSAVYKLLNFVGNGIMKAKIDGENEVRALYNNQKLIDQGVGYTIVRPGGLTNEAATGPSFLEVNQGDDKSGRLSRADVAQICIGCLDVAGTFDTTFECYLKDTAKPVDNVGLSNILRSTDPTSYRSGNEGNGETWSELLGGLKTDFA
ncbi:hypothetical protein ACHAWO_005368 [Cyclotella atomus]|uniref:NAD(P)-binding domain-containing protein n=1 Tax=Cyclotella atomus TaxID=382360 RepID=A0ABD3QGZ9_9STRA